MGTDLIEEPNYVRGAASAVVGPSFLDTEEVYTGLRAQDLQEAKDQLVVETADMLHIPLFTAEALLRDNGKILRLEIILFFLCHSEFLFGVCRMVSRTSA